MRRLLASFLIGMCVGCTSTVPRPTSAETSVQVRAAETGFAKSMADRDFNAFAGFIAEDAVFINGGKPLKGKPEIIAFWKKFFEGSAAPFSWKPEIAEATSTGDLGYTEGPVYSAEGKAFAKFFSTWRRDPSGRWLVVFDNGYTLCECVK